MLAVNDLDLAAANKEVQETPYCHIYGEML